MSALSGTKAGKSISARTSKSKSSPAQAPYVFGGNSRVKELDALRGIAALVVVFHHFRLSFWTGEPQWWLRPFLAGHEAVILFFVLSGYVLTLPMSRGRQPSYGRYLVRRGFRIYLPFVFALVLALFGLSFFYHSPAQLTPWFAETWHKPVSAKLIALQLTMPGTPDVNITFWSLRYEIIMSILMPLIWIAVNAFRKFGGLLLCVLCAAAPFFVRNEPRTTSGVLHVLFEYSFAFVIGAIVCQQKERLSSLFTHVTPVMAISFTVLAWALCAYPAPVFAVPLASIGAAGLILLAQTRPLCTVLNARVPVYLGRISYSMYLVHGTLLFGLLDLLAAKLTIASLLILYIASTLLVSHLFCVFLEEPITAVGKWLTAVRRAEPLPAAEPLVERVA